MQNATILFDLDGTLVDSAPDIYNGINWTLVQFGLEPVAWEVIRPVVGVGARSMFIAALTAMQRPTDEDELAAMRDMFFPYYGEHLADETRPFPGAVEAAVTLAEAGARLGVCTNKREANARALLEKLELTTLFGAIAGGDTFPVKKPHAEHLLGTIAMLRGDAARAVMIGDTEADAEAARAAQVPFIAVSFGYADGPVADLRADVVIDSFAELEDAVRMVLGRR